MEKYEKVILLAAATTTVEEKYKKVISIAESVFMLRVVLSK